VVGGLRAVYFADFGDVPFSAIAFADATATFDEITDISGTFTVYKYDLKGNSSFEQAFNVSRENGTTFFTQTLNLTLTKLTKQDNKQLKVMAYGRPQVFVEDYNGNCFLMGMQYGAEVTGGTVVTGGAMGDLSGYTLTLEGQEKAPAYFIEGAVQNNPFAGCTATVTITTGTNS
jgi:hypothetical protein